MNRQKRSQLIPFAILAVLALVAATFLFFQSWDESEGRFETEPELQTARHDRVEVRRSSNRSSWSARYENIADDEWIPYDESDEDRKKVPVWVRAQILETGKDLVAAEVSLYALDPQQKRLYLIHGRREESGEFFFRVPLDFEVAGARARHSLDHDHSSAFVQQTVFQQPEAHRDGWLLNLRLSQAPSISGRVIDARSGRALVAAEVKIKGGGPRWLTRTNDRGEFELYALKQYQNSVPDWLQLSVQAKGFVTRDCSVDLREAPTEVKGLEIGMQQAFRLGGYLLDESGRAVPDVELTLISAAQASRAPIRPLDFACQTRSDAAGRFVFTGVPALAAAEIRVEARDFLPLRQKIDSVEGDRGDLQLRLQAGRRLSLDPTFPDGSSIAGNLLRVFAEDEKRDWYTIDQNPLAERREIRVDAEQPTRIAVYVSVQQPNRKTIWWRGQLRYDPKSNLDTVTIALARFKDSRELWVHQGLPASCAWATQVKTSFPDSEELDFIDLHFADGKTTCIATDSGHQALQAPGSVLAFGQMGAPLQYYYVAAEPGSEMKLEYRRPVVQALNQR